MGLNTDGLLDNRNQALCKMNLAKHGRDTQLIVLVEECAELIKEASKTLRGQERPAKVKEELVDVIVMTEELRLMIGLSWKEVNEMAAEKLTEALLKDGGEA